MRYLEAVALRLPKRLIVGGHSKGGNLALYAALRAKPAVQERIERVYTHDGPGFKAGTVKTPSRGTPPSATGCTRRCRRIPSSAR